MQVPFPIFMLCLLIHTGIYLTSSKKDRNNKLVYGVLLLLLTWPLWYVGGLLVPSESIAYRWPGLVLEKAPYYFPFLTFLVYIRRHQ